MEINSLIASQLQAHIKKLLILCTATASIYLIKRWMDKKKRALEAKKRQKIKGFPTPQEIQGFIQKLPFDTVASGKPGTLKDLLGELSEFSEDEEWKQLIASVHHIYQDSPIVYKETNDDTGSLKSIYGDLNATTLEETAPDASAELKLASFVLKNEANEIAPKESIRKLKEGEAVECNGSHIL